MASFVRKDMAILQEAYRLHPQEMPHFKKHLLPWLFLRQLGHLFWFLPRAELCVVQFGGYHALLPALVSRLMGKPILIVLGGTDAVRMPSINYGNFNKPFLGWITGLGYRLATALAPVHQTLLKAVYTFLPGPAQLQGVYNLVPGLTTPGFTIYNGFDLETFKPTIPCSERQPGTFVIVAGHLDSPVRFTLKGIDMLLEAALQLPDYSFTIIGKGRPANAPPNTEWIGWTEPADLPSLLSRHRFCMQLSISEGFPNALCEGMLCGCVPIGSAVGAIPDIISNTGYLWKKRDVNGLVTLLQEADGAYKSTDGEAARGRIVQNFAFARRKARLFDLCHQLTTKQLLSGTEWNNTMGIS